MREGGCQCGALRYESAGAAEALYVCHCRECRRQSASAFGISLIVPRAGLRVTKGTPKFWSRPSERGGDVHCAFCPACGSRLWHEDAGGAKSVSLKGGALDDPPDLSQAVHIWTKRKLPGVVIPEAAAQFPGEPD